MQDNQKYGSIREKHTRLSIGKKRCRSEVEQTVKTIENRKKKIRGRFLEQNNKLNKF
jgi:hypothetical protein